MDRFIDWSGSMNGYENLRETIRQALKEVQYIYFQPRELTNTDRIFLQKTLKSF